MLVEKRHNVTIKFKNFCKKYCREIFMRIFKDICDKLIVTQQMFGKILEHYSQKFGRMYGLSLCHNVTLAYKVG